MNTTASTPERFDLCDRTCTVDCGHCKGNHLYAIKSRALRAKHRDGEERVVVDIDDLLALFSDRDRARSARKKYRWLYHRQRGHLRKLIEHFTEGFDNG